MSNDFTHLWSIKKRKRVKEQDRSSLTEPRNGLTVTNGNVTEEDGLERREERENGALRVAHIKWAGGRYGQGSITQQRSVALLQHIPGLMDIDS